MLDNYKSLGRSGLAVSPFGLGTMTFGTSRWGCDEKQSFAILKAYCDLGGNLIDTADVYSGGLSEKWIGNFLQETGLRDQLVIASKAGFGTGGHPHSGGNGAKRIHQALDESLKRLKTDYLDLYWIHVWDMVTPAEEVFSTMQALVASGKIRYWGISNAPAWYISKLSTLAELEGPSKPIALQLEYSLVQRGIEAEHTQVAKEFGLAIQPWSPLGGGLLTGKYDRHHPDNIAGKRNPTLPDGQPDRDENSERLSGNNPFGDTKFTDKNWAIVEAVQQVADEIGCTPTEVALNWLVSRQGIMGTLIGVRTVEQLHGCVSSLKIQLNDTQLKRLDEVSFPELSYPSALFSDVLKSFIFAGNKVAEWGA